MLPPLLKINSLSLQLNSKLPPHLQFQNQTWVASQEAHFFNVVGSTHQFLLSPKLKNFLPTPKLQDPMGMYPDPMGMYPIPKSL